MPSAYIISSSLCHPRLTLVPYYSYLLCLFSSKNLLPIFCAFVCFYSKLRLRVLCIRRRYLKSSSYFTREVLKTIFEGILSHKSGTTHYNQTITPTAHSVVIRKSALSPPEQIFPKLTLSFVLIILISHRWSRGRYNSSKICSVINFVSTRGNLNKNKITLKN